MHEYEYSKEVKDLNKYIKYCEDNGFILESKFKQQRTIYRKDNKTMARITINESNGNIVKELDFKEDKLSSDELIVRKESLSIEFSDDKAVDSILEFLGYKKDNTLIRTRYTYKKGNAKFEFDEYEKPEKKNIIALEGKKILVDQIWINVNRERMNKEELLDLLRTLKISKDEFWALSSSALVLRGIYPDAGDLDIAVTNAGLEELKSNYDLKFKDNGWFIVNELVEGVCTQKSAEYPPELVEGYYLQNIKEYYNYLNSSQRPKDIQRIPMVEEYIRKLVK